MTFKRRLNLLLSSFVPARYKTVPLNILIINFLFQRVLFINFFSKNSIHYTSRIAGLNNIKFNKNNSSILASFAVSGGCYFSIFDGSTLEIGDDTIWSHNVGIHTGTHDLMNRSTINLKDIKIGKNCWLGTGVVITQGVTLGDNVTVGANSVVTKSFPNNVVIAGVPAKIIKYV